MAEHETPSDAWFVLQDINLFQEELNHLPSSIVSCVSRMFIVPNTIFYLILLSCLPYIYCLIKNKNMAFDLKSLLNTADRTEKITIKQTCYTYNRFWH